MIWIDDLARTSVIPKLNGRSEGFAQMLSSLGNDEFDYIKSNDLEQSVLRAVGKISPCSRRADVASYLSSFYDDGSKMRTSYEKLVNAGCSCVDCPFSLNYEG